MRIQPFCGWHLWVGVAIAGGLAAAAQATPSINTPVVNPSTLIVNQSTLVTASCQINVSPDDPALLPGGVNLVRLTAAGAPVSVLGVMQGDGSNDGLYSLQFTTDEAAAGQFGLECTAAFTGLLQRVKSPVFTVTVNSGSFNISSPAIAPASIPFEISTSVTTTATISGGTPDPGSVLLQRLDSSGRVLAIVGTLHDDGLNGDLVANDGIYTLVTTFTEFEIGAVPLRVSATFGNAVNHALSPTSDLTVTGTPPPTVSIISPADLSFLNISPTTVTGTVSDATAKVVINGINAPVDPTGKFSATVPLTEGPNILTAAATSASGTAATASITVTLDTTPPHVTITTPTDQFVTSAASITVAGNVNDIVVGTVNSQQATVTVNGVRSQVANRTFLAQNVPLNTGSNTIQAVAVDRAGNEATTQNYSLPSISSTGPDHARLGEQPDKYDWNGSLCAAGGETDGPVRQTGGQQASHLFGHAEQRRPEHRRWHTRSLRFGHNGCEWASRDELDTRHALRCGKRRRAGLFCRLFRNGSVHSVGEPRPARFDRCRYR